MLPSLREEKEGKLRMLLSPRKNGLDSLFKEVRVFKVVQHFWLEAIPFEPIQAIRSTTKTKAENHWN